MLALVILSCVLSSWPTARALACGGDCSGDGVVGIDELIRAVGIALGTNEASACVAADLDGNGIVAVNELVAAVGNALNGCPAIPTPTDTPALTPTPTRLNQPPIVPPLGIYRTYPGFEVRRSIGATDPDGDDLVYTAEDLPNGAALAAAEGILSWTPRPDQLGPFTIPFTVTDGGHPPASAEGDLVFQVAPPDPCVDPRCDPASGCESVLVPISEPCCAAEPEVRVPEAVADCPLGRVVFLGRNQVGFGRMQNCDRLRVLTSFQVGLTIRFHVRTRCMVPAQMGVRARLVVGDRLLVDEFQIANLRVGENGYAEKRFLAFLIDRSVEPESLEGVPADLTMTLTDFEGTVASTTVRVVLTLDVLPDIPDL